MEDVQTILHFLPLMTAAGGYLSLNASDAYISHVIPVTMQAHNCMVDLQDLINTIRAVILIPTYC